MKNLLNDVKSLDFVLNRLNILAGRIRSGQNVDAWRECNGLIAYVDKCKQSMIESVNKGDSNDK